MSLSSPSNKASDSFHSKLLVVVKYPFVQMVEPSWVPFSSDTYQRGLDPDTFRSLESQCEILLLKEKGENKRFLMNEQQSAYMTQNFQTLVGADSWTQLRPSYGHFFILFYLYSTRQVS